MVLPAPHQALAAAGNSSNTVAVSAIIVTGTGGATTITVDNGTLQMLADVTPANAVTNQ